MSVIATAVDASSAAIALLDESGHLRLKVGIGRFEADPEMALSIRESLGGSVLTSEEPTRIGDLSAVGKACQPERNLRVGPAYIVPIGAHGRTVGVLYLGRDRGAEPFFEADVNVVDEFRELSIELLELILPPPTAEFTEESGGRKLMNALRHEVNNPLAIIMGQAQILFRDPKIREDAYLSQSIEAILEAAERVRTVVRGLTQAGESGEAVED